MITQHWRVVAYENGWYSLVLEFRYEDGSVVDEGTYLTNRWALTEKEFLGLKGSIDVIPIKDGVGENGQENSREA